ncbi:MAG TPA: FAD:protein FMN transferase [Armatimonadota bacterium]|jgi:thiamine biosynthesis lipoprotein ApbE
MGVGVAGTLGRLLGRRERLHSAHYEQVLGTALELRVWHLGSEAGPRAEAAVLAEVDRLEAVFSAYLPSSEFRRWQETWDQEVPVSEELATLLEMSELWRGRSGGAFNPAVDALTRLWKEASARDVAPDRCELASVVTGLGQPLWSVDRESGTARRLTRFPAALNSVAKGYIADRACQAAALVPGVKRVLVNLGGDLRHWGDAPVRVAIADPFAPADNAPPVATVLLRNQGLAASGNYHRGFKLGDRWLSHLIDPRRGSPVDHVVSASVIAGSVALADLLATVFSVLTTAESLALADSLPAVGLLLLGADGSCCRNAAWDAQAEGA